MAEETKHCGTCKYGYLGPGYEPCKSCGDDCSKWESDADGIIPIPVDMRFTTVDETKESEKKYFSVIVTLLQADPCSGFKTMTSTNVLNYYFTDGGIFYAEMDNGDWFMCPKENIHHVKVQQTYKKEN
jgi:hypothetical protein